MRRLPLLLAAAVSFHAPVLAQAQPASPHAVPSSSSAAARLEALFKAGDRGDSTELARALAQERDADVRALIELRLAAMRLDPAVAANPRLRRLAAPAAPPQTRKAALEILSAVAFTSGDYAQAAQAGRALELLQKAAGDAEEAASTRLAWQVAEMLANEPRQALAGPLVRGSTAARRDPAGLTRIDLRLNGQPQDAVFDTGANLSVLSAGTARRLGVRIIDGATAVGNSVQTTVAVRLGIADRLEIAGNFINNVPFLVIDDAQLTFAVGGGYTIPAIIGYPVMQALGRFRMEPRSFSVEPSEGRAAAGDGHNLHAWANELFVDAIVGGIPVALHLDSGANPSHLNAAFAQAHPQPLAGLAREERRLAGAGGTATGQAVRWLNVRVQIGGRSLRVPAILVGVPGSEAKPSPYYGVAGADLLRSFASYTIDLRRMRLELGEPATR
jgi:predicted aspartyl protease